MKVAATLALISMLLLSLARPASAIPLQYTFEGVVTGFESFHSGYSLSDFDIQIGRTPLRYIFVVDFDADQSTTTNTAGTWNRFYSDLLQGSIVNGGREYGDYHAYNWFRSGLPNRGQITSNLANVRVSTDASQTIDWRVQDWQVGQSFRSTDLACYPGGRGGCAVYAYGDVALTSIAQVPLPGTAVLVVLALVGLRLRRR